MYVFVLAFPPLIVQCGRIDDLHLLQFVTILALSIHIFGQLAVGGLKRIQYPEGIAKRIEKTLVRLCTGSLISASRVFQLLLDMEILFFLQ